VIRTAVLGVALGVFGLAWQGDAIVGRIWLDALGQRAELPIPAKRIASLAPSATEILYAIGADDRLVGVSRQCDFPIAAKLKPKVGDFNRPDVEAVVRAKPDVALFTEYVRAEDLEALRQGGVLSFVLRARTVGDIAEAVRLLGALSGRAERAEALAAEMVSAAQEVQAKVAEIPAHELPRVYLEVDGPRRLYAVGPGSFMDDVIRIAGGRNIFAGAEAAYFEVAPEAIADADPDVILIDHPFQYKIGVAKRPGWSTVAAVRNHRVYDNTDFDIILLNRPGPRIVQSLREISRLLHPEAWDVE
jgi:iron complex transport system substrate-binding protein